MSENWRQNLIREKLARLETPVALSREHKISNKLLAALVGYTLLLSIPLIWARLSADLFIGGMSRTDLISRVDFSWQSSKFAALAPVYPVYHELPRDHWLDRLLLPIERLIKLAGHAEASAISNEIAPLKVSADTLREIRDYAAPLPPSQIENELLLPLRTALARWIYSRGLIAHTEIAKEKKHRDSEIEIINDSDHRRIVELNRDYSPIAANQTEPLVRQMLYDALPALNPQIRAAIFTLLEQLLAETPSLIPADTSPIREKSAAVRDVVAKDQLLVMRGQRISANDFAKIIAERQAWRAQQSLLIVCSENIALIVIVFIFTLVYVHLFMHHAAVYRERQLFGVGIVFFAVIVIACAGIRYGVAINFVPIGVLAGIIALSCGANLGMQTLVYFGLLLILIGSRQFGALMAFIAGGCVFAQRLPKEHFRMGIAKNVVIGLTVTVIAGVTYSIADDALDATRLPHQLSDLFNANYLATRGAWTVVSWIASLLVLLATLQSVRKLFGVTSNVVLQDYQEHPLLTKLLTSAPGTYYHSTVVAAISEVGVRAIGGNSMICKIACLYHDIGKILKPQYFAENEQNFSRHDTLSPYMSNLIVVGHVKDGIEMAKRYKLPAEIIDIIAQHHGTTNTEYFLRRAQEERDNQEKVERETNAAKVSLPSVDPAIFQYPGPKPQTIEAAIIMLADSIEAASRSLANPSPEHLRVLVERIMRGKMSQGQFDECRLTFAELQSATEAMLKLLISMFHSRVSYDKIKKRLKS